MALIYDLARLGSSGMCALQSAQRDWSPYLVHFTSCGAMKKVRKLLEDGHNPAEFVHKALQYADGISFGIFQKILESGCLRTGRTSKVPNTACVCLSECTLPGLFGHSERYGRFGFVFKKSRILSLGGHPCVYLDGDLYDFVKQGAIDGAQKPFRSREKKLFDLANRYCPAGMSANEAVKDFTHEREWRIMDNLPLKDNLVAILAPDSHYQRAVGLVKELGLEVPVCPIDMLYEWGV